MTFQSHFRPLRTGTRNLIGLLALAFAVAFSSTYFTAHRPVPTQKHLAAKHLAAKHHAPVKPWHNVWVWVTGYVIQPQAGCQTYDNRTASGAVVTTRSVAVDTRVFPFGTKFRHLPRAVFQGDKWVIHYDATGIAQDTGGLIEGYHLDKAVATCGQAFAIGRRYIEVQYQEKGR